MTGDVSQPLRPKRFWVLGAGHFGQLAVMRIIRHIQGAELTVVDTLPNKIAVERISLVQADGIAWLTDRLDRDAPVDMIVPAIPVHVAAQWAKLALADDFEIHPARIPDAWSGHLPHPINAPNGRVYTSSADFVCPDNCPEPEHICTHTGKPRPSALYDLLRGFESRHAVPIVIRSHQLLPGVGGLYPADMLNALDLVRRNNHRLIMIGTACRCHGVLDFMRLVPRA